MAAWVDRSVELAGLPSVEQVYCFENRGAEIGATLTHPHGQIYAYPYVTPRTARMLRSAADYRNATGSNLFDDVVAAERKQSTRVVAEGAHWLAFVPYAAHWPYEVHLYPHQRVPDLPSLSDAARAEFGEIYLDILRRFDRLFDAPTPYISGLAPGPGRHGRDDFAAAPGAVHDQACLRQAQVPGRLRIRHGRLRQQRLPRNRRPAPPRPGLRTRAP